MGRAQKGGIEDRAARSLKTRGRLMLALAKARRRASTANIPTRRGFAAQWLETGLARELSAEIRLAYDSLGLICTMRLPIRALEP